MRGPNALLRALGGAVFLASMVSAARHNLFVSSFRSRHLFAVSYDDETGVMQEERTIIASAGHPWMTLNRERTVLYASQRDGIASYGIVNPSLLVQSGNISLVGRCQAGGRRGGRHGETSLLASQWPPFNIYAGGPGRTPCSSVVNVRQDGSLNAVAQVVAFNRPGPATESSNESRVEGMAMSRDGKWLFSADSRGEGIWTHAVDSRGNLGQSRFTPMRIEDVRPRRIALHPSGRFLYIVCRRPNMVYTMEVVQTSREQPPNLVLLDVRISLVPGGLDEKRYRGSDVQVSEDGRVLYASVRYREPKPDDDDDDDSDSDSLSGILGNAVDSLLGRQRGRVTAFSRELKQEHLDYVNDTLLTRSRRKRQALPQAANNGILTAILLSIPQYPSQSPPGYPIQILMQAQSPTGGGRSNVAAVAPWNNGVFALSDSDRGSVQIWRLDGIDSLPADAPHGQIAPLNVNVRPNPPLPNIRTSIVAEWHAPPGAVGDPRVNDENEDSDGGLIRFQRGCCANTVWLN